MLTQHNTRPLEVIVKQVPGAERTIRESGALRLVTSRQGQPSILTDSLPDLPVDPFTDESTGMLYPAHSHGHNTAQAEMGRGFGANFDVHSFERQEDGTWVKRTSSFFDWNDAPKCGFKVKNPDGSASFVPCKFPKGGFWKCASCFMERMAKSRCSQVATEWYGPKFAYDPDGDWGSFYKSRKVGTFQAAVVKMPSRQGKPPFWAVVQYEDVGQSAIRFTKDGEQRSFVRSDIEIVAWRRVVDLESGKDVADLVAAEWAAEREYSTTGWDSVPTVDAEAWLASHDPHHDAGQSERRALAWERALQTRQEEMTTSFSPDFLETVVEEGFGWVL